MTTFELQLIEMLREINNTLTDIAAELEKARVETVTPEILARAIRDAQQTKVRS